MEELLKELLSEIRDIKQAISSIDRRLKNIENNCCNDSEENKNNILDLRDINDSIKPKELQILHSEVQNIWNQVIEFLKQEMSPISIQTWIEPIEPINKDDHFIYLKTKSDFEKDILETRYESLIKKAITFVTGKEYNLKYITKDHKTSLNSKCTFESLIIGKHNEVAYKGILNIIQNLNEGGKLLYIYGTIGLGKTYLVLSIENYLEKNNLNIKVSYMTLEKFTNELINSIRNNGVNTLRQRLMKSDIIIFDDLQFIQGKERTQEEFLSIVNQFLENHKSVIITSTKSPEDTIINNDKFLSLLNVDIVAEVTQPDFASRVELLKRKNEESDIKLKDEEIITMAKKESTNIRELINEMNKALLYAKLSGEQK